MYLLKVLLSRLEHNSMALSRTDISDGLITELGNFEDLVRSLSPAEFDSPSRCQGWTAGDVARHAIGGIADVTAGRLDGLGSPEVTAREVAERAGHSADQLADECAAVAKAAAGLLGIFDDTAWEGPAGGGYDGTLGRGVEALWYDTWLHGDDIRNAIGRPPECGDGMRAALSHVEFELRKLDCTVDVPALDDPNAFEFILAATGRADGSSFGANAPIDLYSD
jgi:uncharacterized protein (TIGR03083 family)